MNADDNTLWMGDLEEYMDSDFISAAFAKMGEEVSGVKLVFDKYSGKASGYCFVELSDGEAARRAMLNISGKVMPKSKPPSTFNLSFANSPSAPYTEYNLFVNDIPLEMDDSGLFLVFGEKYRSCRGAKVYRNPDGSSRGLGFVRFADQTDQQRALVEMNKLMVGGKQMKLKLAQPKFRAPRGTPSQPRGTTTTIVPQNYDPSAYYARQQDHYNSPGWQQQQQQQHQQQPQYQPQPSPHPLQAPVGLQAPVSYAPPPAAVAAPPPAAVDPGLELEPYAAESVGAQNDEAMEVSLANMKAMDESRWCPKLLTVGLTETQLEAA